MKTIGILLAGWGVLALTSSAQASFSDCRSIADPVQRLACYDKAAKSANAAATPSARTPVASAFGGAALDAVPARLPVKAPLVADPGPRFWFEAEAGVYGFSKSLPVLGSTAAPASTGPTPVPTAPGFIGLVTMSTVTNPLVAGDTPSLGAGGSYRMGYWLNPERTIAVDGSVFYIQGKANFSAAPTSLTTNNQINTTPDVFVGLFNDTTTAAFTGAAISDQLYGGDINLRMTLPRFAGVSKFNFLVGVRDVAFDENITASVNSTFSRTYQPGLGLPQPTDFTNTLSGSGSYRIWNNFIGPQIGFDAEQHFGRFWVESENKLAVGVTLEQSGVTGSSVTTTTPTKPLMLAGIPIVVTSNAPAVAGTAGAPPFGPFALAGHDKTMFAFAPSGTIKLGYDIDDMLSVTVAYNYLYLSSVGRVGDQVTSPADIKQSSFFAQGVTFGVKDRF